MIFICDIRSDSSIVIYTFYTGNFVLDLIILNICRFKWSLSCDSIFNSGEVF